jgi:hypothetical protein
MRMDCGLCGQPLVISVSLGGDTTVTFHVDPACDEPCARLWVDKFPTTARTVAVRMEEIRNARPSLSLH